MSIMAGLNRNKLKDLLRHWPRGTVAVHAWLESQGIYRQLADSYVDSGWILPVGRGAFVRAGDQVDWLGALYAVQQQLGQHVHVGGKTALALHGSGHFLSMKVRGNLASSGGSVWLFSTAGHALPAWLLRGDWGVTFRVARLALLSPDATDGIEHLDVGHAGGFTIDVSSRERAILEVLHLVPHKQSFEEGQLLMEGLTTLRPSLLQSLLVRCRSVKTKRLFLYLAEAAGHPWLRRLDISTIDLGSGKRVIVKGGAFDPKYQITVPRQAYHSSREVG